MWCVNSLSINLFKSVRERQGQIDFQETRVQSGEELGRGRPLPWDFLPPPWRGRSTWIRAAGPAGPGQRARGTHSSDFWLSQPGARHHLRNIDHHLHCQRTQHFSTVFHWSPQEHCEEVLLIIPLDWKTEAQTSPWLVTWHANEEVQTQVVWCQSPTHNDLVYSWTVAFQTFGSVIYSRKCILYWLRYSIQPWNNIFHKETLCWILETSSDCPVFHTKS